jgi:type I restriction enzyme S subunit
MRNGSVQKVRTVFTASLFSSELPEGWALVPIGDVLTSTEYGLSEPGDSAGNTQIVGMRDIQNGVVNLNHLATVDDGGADWSSMKLRKGDILLNRTNSPDLVGKAAIVRENSDAVFASYLVRLQVDRNRVTPDFVNYWLNSPIAQRALKRLATRAVSQANINPTEFRRYCPMPLPPMRDQIRIAEILGAWDKGIETCERLIELKQIQMNAFSRQFFEPCHPKTQARPTNWGRFELGDIFRERDEQGRVDDQLLSITMSDGVINRNDVGRRDTSNDDKSAYKLILPGDIGYNTMRMWQGVSGLSRLRGIVSPAYTIVTPDGHNIAARYAAHLFKSRRMVFDFERYSQGLTSDTWNLKFPAFAKIRIHLPPMELQHQQAGLMDAFCDELSILKGKREALTKQKRGLMQKLLTGDGQAEATA